MHESPSGVVAHDGVSEEAPSVVVRFIVGEANRTRDSLPAVIRLFRDRFSLQLTQPTIVFC